MSSPSLSASQLIKNAHNYEEYVAALDRLDQEQKAKSDKSTPRAALPIQDILLKANELSKNETSSERVGCLLKKIEHLDPNLLLSEKIDPKLLSIISTTFSLHTQLVAKKDELEKAETQKFAADIARFETLSDNERSEWTKELGSRDFYRNEEKNYFLIRHKGTVEKFYPIFIPPDKSYDSERMSFSNYVKSEAFLDKIKETCENPHKLDRDGTVIKSLTHMEIMNLLSAIYTEGRTISVDRALGPFLKALEKFLPEERKKLEEVLTVLPKGIVNDIFKFCAINSELSFYEDRDFVDLDLRPWFRLFITLYPFADKSVLDETDRQKLADISGATLPHYITGLSSKAASHYQISHLDKERILRHAEIFLKLGATEKLNSVVLDSRVVGSEFNLLDRLFNVGANRDLIDQLIMVFLNNGVKMSDRLASRLLNQLPMTACYVPFMIKQGFITQTDANALLNAKDGAPTQVNCLAQARILIRDLAHNLKVHNNAPQEIPLSLIDSAKKCKSLLKSYVAKQKTDTSPDADELRKVYQQLVELYDTVVEKNPFLKELQSISRDLRDLESGKIQQPSTRLSRFYSLFGPEECHEAHTSANAVQMVWRKEYRKGLWTAMRKRAVDTAGTVQRDDYLKRRQVVWYHGTKSSSLPMIAKTKALMATGQLIKRNIPSFSGEINTQAANDPCYINAERLSGERPSEHWTNPATSRPIYDANTNFLVSWIYASVDISKVDFRYKFDPKISQQEVSVETLLGSILSIGKVNFITPVHIMRLRMTDPNSDKKLKPTIDFINALIHGDFTKEPLKGLEPEQLEKLSKMISAEPLKTQLTKLYNTLTTPIPKEYMLSEEDLKIVTDPKPSALVFASTNVYSDLVAYQEYTAKGPLNLGEEIDVAFVPKDKVQWYQKQLNEFGVNVYDRDVAHYIEMMSMAAGSQMIPFGSAELLDPVVFAQTMNSDILPNYSIPFPAVTRYLAENGKFLPVDQPFFQKTNSNAFASHAEYILAVKEGTALPRHTHGPMHAVRTAIWSRVLAKIYKIPEDKKFWLSVTAGMHDIQRGDDGQDRWDKESAMRLKAYLIMRNLPESEIAQYTNAILNKDPKEGNFVDDVQRAVHDADAIEILRLISLDKFDINQLQLHKLPGLNNTFIQKLLAECAEFIRITDNVELRMAMEQTSKDYAGDVMRVLSYLSQQNRFPVLSGILKADLAAFEPKQLPPQYVKLIHTIWQPQKQSGVRSHTHQATEK